jgi:hypothetical protein
MEGTRFSLFPQPGVLDDFRAPETVVVSTPAGTVGAGPSDGRIYTVYPVGKSSPYGIDPLNMADALLPPWTGDILPPAEPNAAGHFDYLHPGTPQFEMAHLYGTVRFVMDVWEGYFDRPIHWHFAPRYERLELSILPSLDNAYSGFGFIEVGGDRKSGAYRPFSLNFDVIAHEVGHAIIYGEVGIPDPESATGEYFGFHESAADLVALIASLHFNSLVDELLMRTHGNLYTFNALSRMAELSPNTQIRIAANDVRLSSFARGWTKEHLLSQPLTGAFFDIFVDIFHELLRQHGFISPEVEELSDRLLATPEYAPIMQRHFDRAFSRNPDGFKEMLLLTRDTMGSYLADTWRRLDAQYFSYLHVAEMFASIDRETSGGRFQRLIKENFDMRDIGYVRVGPQLVPFGRDSHIDSVRTFVPARSNRMPIA